ncbi:MAG: efflux RND transporter periplasmic adaptor subunit [Planctomycetales bacterium]|nr:efflux RND transporter periplasmic adaptor subunit [Planctomycetales bacterium]
MKKKTFIIGAVIGLVILLFLTGIVVKKKKVNTQTTIVRTETIQPGEFVEIVNAPGEIRPQTKVDISAKVSARIVELPFEEGDVVTAGDPLANPPIPPDVLIRLDSRDLDSQLRSTEAGRDAQKASIEVEKARVLSQKANLEGLAASLNKTKMEYERQKNLLETKDISQSSFEQTESTFRELQAQYDAAVHSLNAAELNLVVMEHNLVAAEARVEEVRETLSYTTMTAPIDGVITLINAEVGEVVMTGTMNNPGTVIMQVADLSTMILEAELDETNIGQVKIGQKAKIHVPAFWDEEFHGAVRNIALTQRLSNIGAKYYKTEILIEGDVAKLYSGLTADVDIETNRYENVIKIPSQAVLARRVDELPLDIIENNPVVDAKKTEIPVAFRFIDKKAVATPVRIGPSDLTHTLIREGLSPGDVVIVGPYKILETLKHDIPVAEEEKKKEKRTPQSSEPKDKTDA